MLHLKIQLKEKIMSCLGLNGIAYRLVLKPVRLTRRNYGGSFCHGANKEIRIRTGCQQRGHSI